MALVFTDWEHCNDEFNPTLDWTSADAIRGNLVYTYMDALWQAVNERTRGNYNDISRPIYADTIWYDTNYGFTHKWGLWFESIITGLIPRFVNYTDHGGNWNGIAAYPKRWTETDLLADIAPGTTRILLSHGAPLSADWCKQQYEILNRLVWQMEIPYSWGFGMPMAYGGQYKHGAMTQNWAEAESTFLASSWEDFPTYYAGHVGMRVQIAGMGSYNHLIERFAFLLPPPSNTSWDGNAYWPPMKDYDTGVITYPSTAHPELVILNDMAAIIDTYLFLSGNKCNDYPDTPLQTWMRFSSSEVIAPGQSGIAPPISIGLFDTLPTNGQPSSPRNWNIFNNTNEWYKLFKFNIPGGFVFQ
jgi:hypothetical protein